VSSSADSAPEPGRRKAGDERRGALQQLIRIERGAYASRLLHLRGPGERARVLGALRWLRTLDYLLAPFCRRELSKLDSEVRWTLRLGMFEIAFLGVPPPVATDAAVRLVRRAGRPHASGLVNAVLRKAHPSWEERWRSAPPGVRMAHPDWLVKRWLQRYPVAGVEAALAADQEPASMWVWFLDDAARRGLAESLRPHPWCPQAFASSDKAPSLAASVRSGEAYAQDPSSQLVAHVAAALIAQRSEPRVAHVCAAPGGKAARLATLHQCRQQVALDRHPGRLRLARELLARVSSSARVVVGDATAPPLGVGLWDLVVVDAPCTGTGTLRRHPELKWRLRPEDPAEMATPQQKLLEAAAPLLSSGGIVLYSTCSIESEENEEVVDSVPELHPVELGALLPPATPAIPTSTGGVRLLPGTDHDGFTIHALTR
jgi:16S rRNA (cytosine967-C5)-methyltransferase